MLQFFLRHIQYLKKIPLYNNIYALRHSLFTLEIRNVAVGFHNSTLFTSESIRDFKNNVYSLPLPHIIDDLKLFT